MGNDVKAVSKPGNFEHSCRHTTHKALRVENEGFHSFRVIRQDGQFLLGRHEVSQALRQARGGCRRPSRPHRGISPDARSPRRSRGSAADFNSRRHGNSRPPYADRAARRLPQGRRRSSGPPSLHRHAPESNSARIALRASPSSGEGAGSGRGSPSCRAPCAASRPEASNSRRSKLLETWMSMDGLVVGRRIVDFIASGLQGAVEDVVLIGRDDQAVDGQRPCAWRHSLQRYRRNCRSGREKLTAPVGRAERERRRHIIDDLRHDARPVDRIDARQA